MCKKRSGLASLFFGVGLIVIVLYACGIFNYWLAEFLKSQMRALGSREGIRCIYSAISITNVSLDQSKSCVLLRIENVGYENITGIIVDVFQNGNISSKKFENLTIPVNEARELCTHMPRLPTKVRVISVSCPSVFSEYEVSRA